MCRLQHYCLATHPVLLPCLMLFTLTIAMMAHGNPRIIESISDVFKPPWEKSKCVSTAMANSYRRSRLAKWNQITGSHHISWAAVIFGRSLLQPHSEEATLGVAL